MPLAFLVHAEHLPVVLTDGFGEVRDLVGGRKHRGCERPENPHRSEEPESEGEY